MLLVGASPAFAERTYESQLTGFGNPESIAIDGHNNVWIDDGGAIKEYEPFPAAGKIGEHGLGYILSIALDDSTETFYAANSGPVNVESFEIANNFASKETWDTENGCGYDYVAVDNSADAASGRVYVARSCEGPQHIQALQGHDEESPFSGSASYISGNEITGTPGGAIGDIGGIATDADGNFYVIDRSSNQVDEFNSEGYFTHAYTGKGGAGEPSFSSISGVAIDPTNGNVLIVDAGNDVVDEFEPEGALLGQIAGTSPSEPFTQLNGGIAVNSAGYLYIGVGGVVDVFTPALVLPKVAYGPVQNPTHTSGTINATVDPNEGGDVTACHFEYGTNTEYSLGSIPCSPNPASSPPSSYFSEPTEVTAELSGLTSETTYHYRVVVSNASGHTKLGADQTYTPHSVTGIGTDSPTDIEPTSATLNGSFVGNGEGTRYYFEWGTDTSYGHTTAVPPGVSAGSPSGPGPTSVSFDLTGLIPVTTYHYRIVASNGVGSSVGEDRTFSTPAGPPVVAESVTDVHSDSALIRAHIDASGGGDTTYHFEYGTAACSVNPDPCTSVPTPNADAGSGLSDQSAQLYGLTAGTVYHFRVVAENSLGTTEGPDRTFTTFPFTPIEDHCPNAHVRQQTGAALLFDCRAYELVSAANTGGYSVESDLAEGQTPFGGYPLASGASGPSRVLYGVHDGGIPGTEQSTNDGVDPYVATRGETGWSTEYVGIPANGTPSAVPFGSPLAEADASLDAFAFAGADLCSPCFGSGIETGMPLHLPDGSLVQGMAGSIEPGPGAKPDGYIAKYFSTNGEHFVFGSTSQFGAGGNVNGDVSIYDRNLRTGETHVVSNTPNGEDSPQSLPCLQGAGKCNSTEGDANGIAELDISKNGSRIIVAQKVSTDAEGNVYWHPYMNIGDSVRTTDLAPGTTHGVLIDGMTEDGSKVFFTTKDKLLAGDTDESADIYEAEVSEGGALTLHLISTGPNGPSNSDSCDPVSNEDRTHWNTVGSAANCDAVAIAGGGGVAATDGTVYFLSPEQLDGLSNGTENEPNLYVSLPGSAPNFIATLSPNDPVVLDAVKEAGTRRTADFQVAPSGEFAAFTSTQQLGEYNNAGYLEVYRYDAATEALNCASCDPTSAEATGNATLAADGLSLTDDGRVFFNSTDALSPRDLDEKEDAYEWEEDGFEFEHGLTSCKTHGGCVDLVSTGTNRFDSSLLGVSADGTDAYFFTRDTLVPQDQNGDLVKLYDARELGGFPYTPPQPLCAASDECHGPGTPPPGPANIESTSTAGIGDVAPRANCRTGFVKRRGKCVKRPHHRRRRRRHKTTRDKHG